MGVELQPNDFVRCLLPVNAVNGNALIQFEHKRCRTRCVVRLRELVFEPGGHFVGMALRAVRLFVVVVGVEHVHQHGLAVKGQVESLGGAGSIGILGGVLLVIFGLFLGALLLPLPVAAELVFDQVVGGEGIETRSSFALTWRP